MAEDMAEESIPSINDYDESRRYRFYFKINNQPEFEVSVGITDYINMKHDNKAARDYILNLIESNPSINEDEQIGNLWKSADGIEYDPILTDEPESSQLPTRATSKKKCGSLVWNHFEKRDNNAAQCTICKKLVKHGNNTTNLHSHLNINHPILVSTPPSSLPKKRKLSKSDSELNETEVPLRQKDQLPRIDEVFNQVDSFRRGGRNADKITNTILHMICVDNMPLCTVENDGFKRLMKIAFPLYNIPDRKTLSKLVDTKYDVLKEKVKSSFESITSFCITCDNWTDNTNQTYLGVTAHYLSESYKMKTQCLGIIPLYERHTAENLKKHLEKILHSYGISLTRITAVVSDRARNIPTPE